MERFQELQTSSSISFLSDQRLRKTEGETVVFEAVPFAFAVKPVRLNKYDNLHMYEGVVLTTRKGKRGNPYTSVHRGLIQL